ncbi:MAG: esterase [Planctomycetes bacterium]|nr:esterase [Planctomycetota bacterium]
MTGSPGFRLPRLALALVASGFLAGCLVPSSGRSITAGERFRTYRVYAPPNLPADRDVPLVLVFHGGGSTARQMERHVRFDALADREGFIAVYPDAWQHNWNDGREDPDIPSQAERIDDIAFVAAILDEVSASYRVDGKRVYATGISNGGVFCHKLAVAMPDRIAAIAPVVGGMAPAIAEYAASGPPVAVFIIQSTADPLVPYGGGDVARTRGRIIDTVAAAKLWARRNGCTSEETVLAPDVFAGDGCRVKKREWTGGAAPVRLWTIVGGGHTWPNGVQYVPAVWIGTVCRDFDGTETIWEFFRGQRLSQRGRRDGR